MSQLRFAILTISDRSSTGERADFSGPALADAVAQCGWCVFFTEIVPDDFVKIQETLLKWCDIDEVDIILTTGGTGFSPRDITPEVTKSVIERETPGLCEAMRSSSAAVTPHAMLSRAAAGIRKKTLIINLPGSPKGAVENFSVVKPVLQHAMDLLRNDPSAEKGHQVIPVVKS